MASSSRKRKSGTESLDPVKKQTCVIHFSQSKCEQFVFLAKCKGPENRLNKLQEIRDQRRCEPIDSRHRMEESCSLVPEELLPEHGYHRDCYQRFTMNLGRLKAAAEGQNSSSTTGRRVSSRSSDDRDKNLFNDDCIFCNKNQRKKIKRKGMWTTEGLVKFASDAWQNVVGKAEEKNDTTLLTRIRGCDLFACEAQFHRSCLYAYMKDASYWRSENAEDRQHQIELEESHAHAFNKTCEFIDREIIAAQKVMKLTELCSMYVSFLQETDHPNPNYRAEKLQAKLEKCVEYKHRLSFCKLEQTAKFKSCLVYDARTSIDRVVSLAYELGTKDMVTEVALHLRKVITEAFEKSNSLPWPPTEEFLVQADVIPSELNKFLHFLFEGKSANPSERIQRLASSVGQDICRAVTNGRWTQPKHVLVCMTLRHLFRSAQLITLMHKLGHCEHYTFVLELETAIGKALEEASNVISTQIAVNPITPSVFHSEFDNFDQLLSVVHGLSSVHTAHGIMLQEVEGTNHGGAYRTMPSIPRTGERSLNLTQEDLPECFITQRKSPPYAIKHLTVGGEDALERVKSSSLHWILLRKYSSMSDQEVPAWAGFISLCGQVPEKKTTLDYYPVIHHPITEYKTVQECLRLAEEATREVGQEYVIITFDLGVCMKAYPIVWNRPDQYKKHIILIGTFHLACAYFKMLGKKLDGAGFGDILLEAGLISSGSLQGVLSGKHYERALSCHKIMLESLERLLLERYLEIRGEDSSFPTLSEDSMVQLHTTSCCFSKETFTELQHDETITNFMTEYEQFRDRVREGDFGPTAQFWLSYIDHVWLVLALLEAVKVNNFLLYAQTISQMSDLFFSFDGQNYARYLTFFSVFLSNIDLSHPGAKEMLQRGAFSVARSLIPGNRCAVDKTMEETFMKHAKSRGGAGGGGAGLTGMLCNQEAYHRWVKTTHERSKYLHATLDMAGMAQGDEVGSRHRDTRPSEILKSESHVKKTQDAIKSFINPFCEEAAVKLTVLSSGASVPADIQHDVLRAEKAGKSMKDEFITQRLMSNDHFFEPIKRLNLKTMASMNKSLRMKSTKKKIVEYKQQGNIAFQLLVKAQDAGVQLDLKELMAHQLTPVPYSIATADNFLAKTDKAKGFGYLTKDLEDATPPPTDATLVVIDGNAVFHCLQQLPSNFREISQKVLDMLPKSTDVVFSTDMYTTNSIKSMERKRRGTGDKIIVKGENTKRPADWKTFLSNDENKKQFTQVLLDVWSKDENAPKYKNRKIILICEGEAFLLQSPDEMKTTRTHITALKSTQEETDSRVALYCAYAEQQGYKFIRVKSPDSDIFFILLHFALQLKEVVILFETGTGNKHRLINVSDIANAYGQQHCSAFLALHAYTGSDTTSAFKGIGKVKPIKVLLQNPRFLETFAQLGDAWRVSEEVKASLEAYTCVMYGRHRFTSVNDLRHQLLKERCGDDPLNANHNVDMASMPPCKETLQEHIKRSNYQVAIWKRALEPMPDVPPPSDGHGWTNIAGTLEPVWSAEDDILPSNIVDFLEDLSDSDNEEEEEDDVISYLEEPVSTCAEESDSE